MFTTSDIQLHVGDVLHARWGDMRRRPPGGTQEVGGPARASQKRTTMKVVFVFPNPSSYSCPLTSNPSADTANHDIHRGSFLSFPPCVRPIDNRHRPITMRTAHQKHIPPNNCRYCPSTTRAFHQQHIQPSTTTI